MQVVHTERLRVYSYILNCKHPLGIQSLNQPACNHYRVRALWNPIAPYLTNQMAQIYTASVSTYRGVAWFTFAMAQHSIPQPTCNLLIAGPALFLERSVYRLVLGAYILS